MAKLLLLLVIAVAALLYFPQTRPLIVERTRPVLDRVFTWATTDEMERIAHDLVAYEDAFNEFPESAEDFLNWLTEQYQADDAMTDSWGSPYAFKRSGASFTLVSAGPDEQFGTDDDLQVEGHRSGGSGRR